MITYDDLMILVANRMKWAVAQHKPEITLAIESAIAEYGVHVDIVQAQATDTITINAGEDTVTQPQDYSKIITVQYEYLSGGNTKRNHLTHRDKTEFDQQNTEYLSDSSQNDNQRFYTLSGNELQIGLGKVKTGGSIIITYQKRLTSAHYTYIPNPIILVDGAESYLRDSNDPAGLAAKSKFLAALKPQSIAAQEVVERYNQRQLDDEILANQDWMDTL